MKKTSTSISRPEEYDPESVHRIQSIWQIWVPGITFLVIILIIAGLAVYTSTSNAKSIHLWGDISAVSLILPALIAGVFLLVINAGMIYLLARLLRALPIWMLLARMRVFQAAYFVRFYADKIVAPILKIKGWKAGVSTILNRFTK